MDLSYKVELWGSTKIVFDRYEEGRNTLTFLINFYKDRINIEEKSVQKLQKLCSKSTQWTEKGTIKDAWEATRKWHDEILTRQNHLTGKLQLQVIQPLMLIRKSQEMQKATLLRDITRYDQNLEKARDLLNKAKAKYHKAAKDHETTTIELMASDLKPKDAEKLKLKCNQEKSLLDSSLNAYNLQIEEFRMTQDKYKDFMEDALHQFEEMEMQRLEKIKEVMTLFVELQEEFAMDHKELIPSIKGPVNLMDREKDIYDFIDVNKTHNVPEAHVEFEPFEGTDYTSEVDHDTKKERKKSRRFFIAPFGSKKKSESSDSQTKEVSKDDAEEVKPVLTSESTDPTPRENGDAINGDKVEIKSNDIENPEAGQYPDSVANVTQDQNGSEVTSNGTESANETPRDTAEVTTITIPQNIHNVAIALYAYSGEEASDLSFAEGSLIIVTKLDGVQEGWMEGVHKGVLGLFPANYVELLEKPQICVALYDFPKSDGDELALAFGDEVVIKNRMDLWYEGTNYLGFTGLFPSNYVELK